MVAVFVLLFLSARLAVRARGLGTGAMLAGSAGIWLFYVQHQFEDAYWQTQRNWDYADAALQGARI